MLLGACSSSDSGKPSGPSDVASAPATGGAAPGNSSRNDYADWPTYHGSNYRAGFARSMPAVSGAMKVVHRLKLDGAVYGSPIVVGGVTVVATENDTVYAFDSAYRTIWKKHLGTPSPARERPCGNIDPLGITGAPAYSPITKLVYMAPEFSGSPPSHQLVALSLRSGRIAFHRSLDLPGVDPKAMQERGALAVHGSSVYVPFGGLDGDCGAYKGRVIGIDASGAGRARSFTVPTGREAGIWTPPGPTIDNAGHLLVAVGNGASGVGDSYDYSDSVLELSTDLRRTDSFSPTTWPTDNDADLDLGSQGPAIVGPWVFSAGKSGMAYVLRRTHLGGIGGQVSQAKVCTSFGGTAVDASIVFVPCTDGLRAVSIDSAGRLHVRWHTASATTGSPVIGGGRVFSLDPSPGVLHALSMSTGRSMSDVAVGAVTRFATPAIYGPLVIVPTSSGITVVRTS